MGTLFVRKCRKKLKFSKNVKKQKCAPKMVFFNEKNGKIWIVFDIEN
jgi:hypothetical protein